MLDTFEKLRPKMKMLQNYAEAAEQINTMIDQSQLDPEVEDGRGCEDDESSADEEIEEDLMEEEEEEVADHDSKVFEDHDFDKEFSKLVTESLDHRKVEKKVAAFDTPIPFKMKRSTVESNESQVSFTLLTKRGNKPQVFNAFTKNSVKAVRIAHNEFAGHERAFNTGCGLEGKRSAQKDCAQL